jgi:1-deoxy-D-xylulose-5-phosphate synthase
VLEYVSKNRLNASVLALALPDDYIEHASVDVLRKEVGLDAQSLK